MRLGRTGMHFCLVVLALVVMMCRFAVVMCGRFVFRSRRCVMCAGRMFLAVAIRISFKGTSMTFRGEMPV